jgi:hypothetical protein
VRPLLAPPVSLSCFALALLAPGLAVTTAGCKEKHPPAAETVGSVAPDPTPAPSARRPVRRYYLARTATRCEIYFADPGSVSLPQPTPCPLILQVGERIRVAGKTCVREGGDPDRIEPVVCPDPLTNFEKQDRAAQP